MHSVRRKALLLLVCIASLRVMAAQDSLSPLLHYFENERNRTVKEKTLLTITSSHPEAGPGLLEIAQRNNDGETRWLAIRGLGYLKYRPAIPFLKQQLSSKAEYVRSNSARALGEMRDIAAAPDLMRLFSKESDDGVLQQTALALQMIGAKEAIPMLESRAGYGSSQTRTWILGSIEVLGTKAELPFFARLLDDPNPAVDGLAANAVERLSGQDFGVPKCSHGPCPSRESEEIQKAKDWWAEQIKTDHR